MRRSGQKQNRRGILHELDYPLSLPPFLYRTMPARNRTAPSAIAPNWPSALKYEVIPQTKSKPPRTNKTIAKCFLTESSVLRHI
jgi:hypothetical protein